MQVPKVEPAASAAAPGRIREDRRRTILVADDHEDTRLMLKTLLEMHCFNVFEAADGKTAVQLVEKERPDVVLMDSSLPVMAGLDALRMIRANAEVARVPIIFLSGHAGPAPQIAAQEAGCDDYLIKPVDLEKMLQLINRRIVTNA